MARNLNETSYLREADRRQRREWKLDHQLVIGMAPTCELAKFIIHCDCQDGRRIVKMYIKFRIDFGNGMHLKQLSEHSGGKALNVVQRQAQERPTE